MKKKILSLCLVVALAATAVIGGTLAYFTDTDNATNVMTMGNVEIDLEETYEQNSTLVPGLDINKDVWVENEGTEEAYVRVHMAFPANMDDGDPNFNASKNFLHWNFEAASYADGKWSFLPEYSTGNGYKGNGAGNWNFYTDTIGGVDYNIYVATYRTALAVGGKTENALDKIYLDATVDGVTNADDSVTYKDTKGNKITLTSEQLKNIQILVYAEGTQIDTFENAYDALNTAFGTPGSVGYVSPWNKTE